MAADLIRGDAHGLRDVRVLIRMRLRVVVVNPEGLGLSLPQLVEPVGRGAHPRTVSARLAEEQNRLEPARLETPAGVDQQFDEAVFRQRDGAGLAHMTGRRIPAAFGDVGDDWRDQRLAESTRDLVRGVVHDKLVLAVHHVRALLLGARRADDDRGGAGLGEVADLGPGEVFEEHGIGRLSGRAGRRGIRRTLRRERDQEEEQGRGENRRCFHKELGDILRAARMKIPAIASLVLAAGVLVSGWQPPADAKLQAQLAQLFPSATSFSPKVGEPPHYKAHAGGETVAGYAFWTTELEPLERGFDGPIKILVGMDTTGVLTGIIVAQHNEPYGNFSIDLPRFPAQFRGKTIRIPSRSAPTSTQCRGPR